MNRRGFLSSLLGAACLAATRHFAPNACSIATKPEVAVVFTLADAARKHGVDVDAVFEILSMQSPLLNDAEWIDGNQPAAHRTTIRTSLPSTNWRKL